LRGDLREPYFDELRDRDDPEFGWAARSVPFHDYLLEAPADAAVRAGWQCILVIIPQVARVASHKLHSSMSWPENGKTHRGLSIASTNAWV